VPTLLLQLLWLTPAGALQLELTPAELCTAVERVVVAEITDIDTRYTEDGPIERLVHASVSRTVKGPSTDGVDFVLPGGEVGGMSFIVSDVPNLMANGHYLLFLSPQDGRLQIQGGEQGAMRITPQGAFVGIPLEEALEAVQVCHAQ
jgi:hypothetical protein